MLISLNNYRIFEDIRKIPYNFLKVYKSYGCIVKGIGQNNGIRYVKNVDILNNESRVTVDDATNTYNTRSKEKIYQYPTLSHLAEEGLNNMINKSNVKFEL